MREITSHRDGLGLNDKITIVADDVDTPHGGGASHHYTLSLDGEVVGDLQFQHGPRDEPGSTAGLTDQALLAVVLDRLDCFQRGPFSCPENAVARDHVEAALSVLRARAEERARRGVLGKNQR